MIGKLVQVASNTVTSPVASVTLTGIDSDDVYMVAFSNVSPATAEQLKVRLTESGTANTTANYDFAAEHFRTSGAYENPEGTDATSMTVCSAQIHASTGNGNGILYLYSANDSSENSFLSSETVAWAGSSQVAGDIGVNAFTVTSAVDGVNFFINGSHNIDSGTFTLYKVA